LVVAVALATIAVVVVLVVVFLTKHLLLFQELFLSL
jgi:hypothetical protein